MKKNILLVALLAATLFAYAEAPKHEMRATWVATVTNIDWPTAQSATNQKRELLQIIQAAEDMHINTIFFQVRTCCDALYDSAYEPRSSYLKINRGATPSYDPLQYAIEECHKRGIACHAWMNPYRYSRDGKYWTGVNDSPLNYEHTHPEWLLPYSNNIILDPALPEVRKRICEVVGDVLNKYDVDGIIFDDYFYPYGGTTNQDAASVEKYKPADMKVGDWRRNNIRMMVQEVYDTIQSVKPHVVFGISPFGIWTTDALVARERGIVLPTGISGGNMYEEIYCDPVSWLEDGTVDYVSPQLYWRTGGAQDYNKLCPWWAKLANQFGRHFYSSMAVYKYHEKTDSYYTIAELQKQTRINRTSSNDNAPGAVLYSTRGWYRDKTFKQTFVENEFATIALPPAINWKPTTEQTMVTNLALNGQELTWKEPLESGVKNQESGQLKYAIYAVRNADRNKANVFSDGASLVGIAYTTSYTLPETITSATHKIGVAVLDRYNNEYSLRILGEATVEGTATTLEWPTHNRGIEQWPVTFRWAGVSGADSYVLQIARDKDFQDILVTHEQTGTQFNSSARLNLKAAGNGVYYWRVKTRKANANDIWSAVQAFEIGVADGLEDCEVRDAECGVRKVMEDGRVVIVRDGEKYDMLGVRL